MDTIMEIRRLCWMGRSCLATTKEFLLIIGAMPEILIFGNNTWRREQEILKSATHLQGVLMELKTHAIMQ